MLSQMETAQISDPSALLENLVRMIWVWLPFAVTGLVVVATLVLTNWFLLKRKNLSQEKRLPRQITMVVLTLLAIIIMVLALPGTDAGGPVSENTRGNLLGLIGLSVTALITLSSTTLAANAMAGIMLRATAPFVGGDWVRVGEHFGRVTERGLFHTEVQTEDKDLLSLPNLLLATNPVRILHESGTIVSAEVSLGYDCSHSRVEPLLIQAATETGLKQPFVWILELKDHAVVYRIAGLLEDVTGLISVRSRLRRNLLDTLHEAGVEIASPSIMIQRRSELTDSAIPEVEIRSLASKQEAPVAEEHVFDKADEAARRTELETEQEEIKERVKFLKSSANPTDAETEAELAEIEERLATIKAELDPDKDEEADADTTPTDKPAP
ncbi:mechanosensitive ion channel domain-containing protein [Mucisphaera sp.]|uniref:mechanosensitive ion channel family protein n=1 Tax=Mucisphaera sp. TaxID=2913024 RepID=UPI003D0A5597